MNAERKYVEFHSQQPVKIGEFHKTFKIPQSARIAGDAVNVLYSSDKLNPETGKDEGWIDYIHDHKEGVAVYRTDAHFSGRTRKVPKWIWGVDELTWLGHCLGFAYNDESGKEVQAQADAPLPELFTIPSGRALIVVQSKSHVLAMIWGGKLGVERRGIVG